MRASAAEVMDLYAATWRQKNADATLRFARVLSADIPAADNLGDALVAASTAKVSCLGPCYIFQLAVLAEKHPAEAASKLPCGQAAGACILLLQLHVAARCVMYGVSHS